MSQSYTIVIIPYSDRKVTDEYKPYGNEIAKMLSNADIMCTFDETDVFKASWKISKYEALGAITVHFGLRDMINKAVCVTLLDKTRKSVALNDLVEELRKVL